MFGARQLVLAVPLLATCFARAGDFGIVVGARDYEYANIELLRYADEDGRQFADHLKSRRGGAVDPSLLINQDATHASVAAALDLIVGTTKGASGQAAENDRVFLFFSLRGAVSDKSIDAYLMLLDSNPELPETAISIDSLRARIAASKAQVILLADVSRRPGPPWIRRNLINLRLEQSLKDRPNLKAILATKPRSASVVLDDKKFGAFGYYVQKGLQNEADGNGDRAVELSELYRYLLAATKLQTPHQFGGGESSTLANLKEPGPTIARVIPKYPILLADATRRLSIFGSLLAAPAPQASPIPLFRRALDQRTTAGAETALDLYDRNPGVFEPDDRRRLAIRLEEIAQTPISRYGRGNQFPNDPLRPTQADYERAALYFDRAKEIRQSIDFLSEDADRSLSWRAAFSKGRAAYLGGSLDEAVTELTRAAAIDEGVAPPHNALGVIHFDRAVNDDRLYVDAIDAFDRAIDRAPNWAYARHNRALAHSETGDYSAADAGYREAIDRTPAHPYLHYNLGVLAHRLNRRGEAERSYRAALEKFDDQRSVAQAKLDAWAEQNRSDELASYVTRHIEELNRNEAEVRNSLGALLHSRRRLARAAEQFDAALALRPNDPDVLYNFAGLRLNQSETEEAVRLLDDAIAVAADHIPARSRLGEIYLESGDAAEARLQYQAILSLPGKADFQPAVAGLHEAQADAAVRGGDQTEACQLYTSALSKTDNESGRRRLRKKLSRLCD